jgi:hypothetical protein
MSDPLGHEPWWNPGMVFPNYSGWISGAEFIILQKKCEHAEELSKEPGPSSDKLAHCYFSCELTRSIGSLNAFGAGALKELVDLLDGDSSSHADWADLKADDDGLLCAGKGEYGEGWCGWFEWTPTDCEDCCRKKY